MEELYNLHIKMMFPYLAILMELLAAPFVVKVTVLLPVGRAPCPHLLLLGMEFLWYPKKKSFLSLARENE